MVFLKEDGSLDIERINQLPLEDFIRVVESLTEKDYSYFASNQMINECIPVRTINADWDVEKDWVDADELINNMRKRLVKK